MSGMTETYETKWEIRIVIILFIIIILAFFSSAVNGSAWIILNPIDFTFQLVILSFLLAVTAGAVLTYSFVSFSQYREIRHLMLLIMGGNIILWIFLFLLSLNP